ncbi:MAG: copper chaperone PCu(A)C [Burkholderiales bacterium]|nr:copper chaperone PCu(A)C [Burkholderiales bacterium]
MIPENNLRREQTRRGWLRRAAFCTVWLPLCAAHWPTAVLAHGNRTGDLRLLHPYATPTLGHASTGALYLVAIHNQGETAERLLAASTPIAERVELYRMQMDGDVMRMQAVPFIAIPPRTRLTMRQGRPDGHHLMLAGLRRPLVVGDRFPLTLHFERSGVVKVEVWVQQDPAAAGHPQH